MANPPILVAGVPGSKPYPRLEINEFINNYRFFSLFVQAFDALKDRAWNTDDLSYYQISGIRDYPRHPWNGATACKLKDYFMPDTPLLLLWLRAYVVLFEQAIQSEATRISAEYTTPDKDEWVEAATKLRLPYWDFALTGHALPPTQFLTDAPVTITLKDGTTVQNHPNPFHSYTFPDGQDDPTAEILRCPTKRGTGFEKILEDYKISRRAAVRDVLLRQPRWTPCPSPESKPWDPVPIPDSVPASSLKTIHDDMRKVIGGSFGSAARSAFDPLSWIFYCSMDHLLTLWNAIHFDAEFPAEVAGTELVPFWSGPARIWLASEILDIRKFNYTYPELDGIDMRDQEEVKTYIQAVVEYYYGNASHMPPRPGQAEDGNLAASAS